MRQNYFSLLAGAFIIAGFLTGNSIGEHKFFGIPDRTYGDSLYMTTKCDCGVMTFYYPIGVSKEEMVQLMAKGHKAGCVKKEIIAYSIAGGKKKKEVVISEFRTINKQLHVKAISGKINIYGRYPPIANDKIVGFPPDIYIQKGELEDPVVITKAKSKDDVYNMFSDNKSAKEFLDLLLEKKGRITIDDFIEAAKIYNKN